MSDDFNDYQKLAEQNTTAQREGGTVDVVLAGNGKNKNQVQLKSTPAYEMMFVRENSGGTQQGNVIINSSGYKFSGGSGGLPLNKGEALEVEKTDASGGGGFNHDEVVNDSGLIQRPPIKLFGYGGQHGKWYMGLEHYEIFPTIIWHEDLTYPPPPPPTTPSATFSYVVGPIEIPPAMRGFPMIIRIPTMGNVNITAAEWVHPDGDIPITSLDSLRWLAGREYPEVVASVCQVCGYLEYFPWTYYCVNFTKYTTTYLGPTIVCPEDYGTPRGWDTLDSDPSNRFYPIENHTGLYPPHYRQFGHRMYADGDLGTLLDLDDANLATVQSWWGGYGLIPDPANPPYKKKYADGTYGIASSKIATGLSDPSLDTFAGWDIRYFGGVAQAWDGNNRVTNPPPWTKFDGTVLTQAYLRVHASFGYGLPFSRFFYNGAGSNSPCAISTNQARYQNVWDRMGAGEGWRMTLFASDNLGAKGGYLGNCWVGGWVSTASGDSGLAITQDYIYQKAPCQSPSDGEGYGWNRSPITT